MGRALVHDCWATYTQANKQANIGLGSEAGGYMKDWGHQIRDRNKYTKIIHCSIQVGQDFLQITCVTDIYKGISRGKDGA